ncbi:hypothetical protein [Maridesulfovibrio sp.]|uniref:hypothetical protein n=1 Tax=unclassified Maridesulfovibrio TaxID=2794999 RepID=UPI003B000DA1
MRRKTSMVWIFSFADLAFILVLALAIMPKADTDYAQLQLSSAVDSSALAATSNSKIEYRVYVAEPSNTFSILFQEKKPSGEWKKVERVNNESSLLITLQNLKTNELRPDFVAAEKSNTGDLLLALSMIRKVWPEAEVWTTVKKKNNNPG